VKKDKYIGLYFFIDKLTNSIENVITGGRFKTDISVVAQSDLKSLTKKNGWLFDWKSEFKEPARDIFRLTIVGNPTIIQGLINVSFLSKSQLVDHYVKTLGAFHFGGRVMIIETQSAL
jgi:hypothetical protein